MKAAGYDVQGAPGVLKYVDIPDPVAEPDDVLISVETISIEGGADQPPFDAASLSFMGRRLRGRGQSDCRSVVANAV